jgi:hypothetical protein
MFKKFLPCFVSLFMLLASTMLVAGSLIPRQSAQAMKVSEGSSAIRKSIGVGGIVTDSFQRVMASGWGNSDTGGWWTVVGSPWAWSVSQGVGSVNVGGNSVERAYLPGFKIQNVDIVEKMVLPRCNGGANCDAFILGRYSPTYNPTFYRVGIVQGAGKATMLLRAQRSDGTSLGSDLDTGLPAANGAVVWLHVEFQGANPTSVRARAWLDGTTEPSSWLLNTSDNTNAEQAAGMAGLEMHNEESTVNHIFQVESYKTTGAVIAIAMQLNPSTSGTSHWLYVVVDGEVYVYDIDNKHALISQFSIPESGKRGVGVAPKQGILYVSFCGSTNCAGSHGSLLAYDLIHNVVAWVANYSFGVDQFAVTPDGSTIYMPHGADSGQGYHTILNASNGQAIGTITTGTDGHNTIASLDGTRVYLAGHTGSNYNYAHVVNTASNQVTLNAGPAINGIRPFTVNSTNTLMFTTSTNTCGFQVLSLTTGKVLYTIPFSGSCNWTVSDAPSHGISLSPDEKRVYIMDAPLDQLEVYNISGLPSSAPVFVASVPLSSLSGSESPCQTACEHEGWVLNDLSGRYVYVGDTGNVVDTSTLSVIATLPALQNTRQVIEVDWANGVPSATSTRFGLGRASNILTPTPSSSPSPLPSPTSTVTVLPSPSPSQTQGSILARDTFQRSNQALWGTASGGQTWGADANSAGVFSIVNNSGQVSNGSGIYNAVLGPTASDAEVLFSGSMSSYSNANLGAVLRWTDTSNWYKAYISGTSLVVQKRYHNSTTLLGSVPFVATAGTSYTLRFRAVGTTLYARAWQTGTTEPASWQITVTDTTFASGYCGLRMQIASGVTASYTAFVATVPGGTLTPTPSPSPTLSPSPSPSTSPSPSVTASPSPTVGTTLAQDSFQRANQALWGTASDGQTWGADANTSSVFSMVNNTGQVSNGTTTYNAMLGPKVANAEVLFSGSMSSYSNANLGAVLRWTDTNDWYKAYINGTTLVVQKKVSGSTTIIGSTPFTASAGTSYSLRFRIVGTTLYARVWQTGMAEPNTWQITVTDTTFSSGYCGLRLQLASGVVANYTSFLATAQ